MRSLLQIESLLVLSTVDLALRVFGYSRVLEAVVRLSTRRPRSRPSDDDRILLDRFGSSLRRVRRYYYRNRKDCLPRALTTFFVLRRRGLPVDLVLGVKKFPFSGHTWVEYAGAVVNDSPEICSQYVQLKKVAS